jgi:hypothetical protein
MLKLKPALLLLLITVFTAGSAFSAVFHLTANITIDQEVGNNTPAMLGPPTTSTGDPRPVAFGMAHFILNTDDALAPFMTMMATVNDIDVTGSQTADTNDNLVAAHIHAGDVPAPSFGVRWGFFGMPFNDTDMDVVLTPFTTGVGGTFAGTWDAGEGNNTTLAAQIPNILAGRSYINFHTMQFGGGEIRGQIVPEPSTTVLIAAGALALAGLRTFRRRRLTR